MIGIVRVIDDLLGSRWPIPIPGRPNVMSKVVGCNTGVSLLPTSKIPALGLSNPSILPPPSSDAEVLDSVLFSMRLE
jgi:hypothetical protein